MGKYGKCVFLAVAEEIAKNGYFWENPKNGEFLKIAKNGEFLKIAIFRVFGENGHFGGSCEEGGLGRFLGTLDPSHNSLKCTYFILLIKHNISILIFNELYIFFHHLFLCTRCLCLWMSDYPHPYHIFSINIL